MLYVEINSCFIAKFVTIERKNYVINDIKGFFLLFLFFNGGGGTNSYISAIYKYSNGRHCTMCGVAFLLMRKNNLKKR